MPEIVREKTREQREAEALWITGKKGFFDHGAIDDGAIRVVIAVLAPTHDQDETFAVIREGLGGRWGQGGSLRTSRAFGWNDVEETVRDIYSEMHQPQSRDASTSQVE